VMPIQASSKDIAVGHYYMIPHEPFWINAFCTFKFRRRSRRHVKYWQFQLDTGALVKLPARKLFRCEHFTEADSRAFYEWCQAKYVLSFATPRPRNPAPSAGS